MVPCLKFIDKVMGTTEVFVALLDLCYLKIIVGRLDWKGQV